MRNLCKKCTATLLSVALLLSCIITGTVASAEGTPAGTEADPVMITTADQLLAAVKSKTDTYYKLANDIVINDIKVIVGEGGAGEVYDSTGTTRLTDDEKAALTKWNEEMTEFAGTLDGDGHIVRGLYVSGKTTDTSDGADYSNARGLINKVANGVKIKNLGLEDVYVSYTGGTAAGFIGNSAGADVTLENCYVDDSAYFYGYNVGIFLGSGNRKNTTATIKNCYSQATIAEVEGDGGTLAGNIWGTSAITWDMDGFYTTSTYLSDNRKNNYNNAIHLKVHEKNENITVDGNSGTAFDDNTFFPGDGFAAVEGELPTLKVFKDLEEDMWGGLADSTIEGAGTEAEPYLITTGEELAHVAYNNGKIAEAGEYFKLTNDIYLNNVFAENWKANADNNVWNDKATADNCADKEFLGNLDGDGYCICGIWLPETTEAYSAGLFPRIGSVTVKNLGIKESQIYATYYSGGLAGWWKGDTTKSGAVTVSNCFVDSTVDVAQTAKVNGGAGGFIGYTQNGNSNNVLTIENCYSEGNFTSAQDQERRANGLIGTSWTAYYKINSSYSTGYPPFCANNVSTASYLATDRTVDYYLINDEQADAKPTDNSNYVAVYDDRQVTYTYNTSTKEYSSATTYGELVHLQEAYSNIYSDEKATTINSNPFSTQLSESAMLGADALESMTGFESAVWYAVKNDTKSPMLRVHGTAIGDVNEDGVGLATGDDEALRKHLIGTAQALNGNYNKDDAKDIDILDLVALTLAQKKITPENCLHIYDTATVIEKSTATTKGTAKLTCAVCGNTKTETLPTEVKILAIGNSFSVDAMEYLWNILTDAGVEKVTLGNVYKSGCDLNTHWEYISNKTAGYIYYYNNSGGWSETDGTTLEYGLTDEDWDFITVQQSSKYSGITDSYEVLPDLLNYLDENKTNEDAKILWHMTWAYSEDYVKPFDDYNGDQMTMYNAITETVQDKVLTETLISGVIPSGTTVQNMRTSYLGDTLTRDGYHMNKDYGRYAVGLTWMTAITGITPDKVDWVPTSDTTQVPKYKELINEAVTNAIANPYVVTNSNYTTAPSN